MAPALHSAQTIHTERAPTLHREFTFLYTDNQKWLLYSTQTIHKWLLLYNLHWQLICGSYSTQTIRNYTAKQFRLYIPFLGIARPQPQFLHSCVCERFINVFPGSVHIFPLAETAAPLWEYIIRSQTHECGNWDWGPDIPFLGIFASNFLRFSLQCGSY